jgi:hypothetical protein
MIFSVMKRETPLDPPPDAFEFISACLTQFQRTPFLVFGHEIPAILELPFLFHLFRFGPPTPDLVTFFSPRFLHAWNRNFSSKILADVIDFGLVSSVSVEKASFVNKMPIELLSRFVSEMSFTIFESCGSIIESIVYSHRHSGLSIAFLRKSIEFKYKLAKPDYILRMCSISELTTEIWMGLSQYKLDLSESLSTSLAEQTEPLFAVKLWPKVAAVLPLNIQQKCILKLQEDNELANVLNDRFHCPILSETTFWLQFLSTKPKFSDTIAKCFFANVTENPTQTLIQIILADFPPSPEICKFLANLISDIHFPQFGNEANSLQLIMPLKGTPPPFFWKLVLCSNSVFQLYLERREPFLLDGYAAVACFNQFSRNGRTGEIEIDDKDIEITLRDVELFLNVERKNLGIISHHFHCVDLLIY